MADSWDLGGAGLQPSIRVTEALLARRILVIWWRRGHGTLVARNICRGALMAWPRRAWRLRGALRSAGASAGYLPRHQRLHGALRSAGASEACLARTAGAGADCGSWRDLPSMAMNAWRDLPLTACGLRARRPSIDGRGDLALTGEATLH